MKKFSAAIASFLIGAAGGARGAEPAPPTLAPTAAAASATPKPATQDARGNPVRRAVTGHVSNYDEAKVGTFTLPDPLVAQNGGPVHTAEAWFKTRRPELMKLYETEI